jgi:lysophospholipase L1-like esterase
MKFNLHYIFLLFSGLAFSQTYLLDSLTTKEKNLINFEANTLLYGDSSKTFHQFFKKLDKIYKGENEKLHIFHIGGSHIQADIYSNKLRTYFHNMNEVSMGQRGFVFPYHIAHTNNPSNYRIESRDKDKWQGYRCAIRKDTVTWGLSGISAAFRSFTDTISVKSNYKNLNKKPYTFNKLRVFYDCSKDDYTLKVLDSSTVLSEVYNTVAMYKEFRFKKALTETELKLQIKDTTIVNPEFLLMGMEFLNDNSGIEYTSIGVNGASFKLYDRGNYFEQQLELYCPDLFIISVGTNDAYMPKDQFDPENYRYYFESFIKMIQRVNPDCAILLTVPNDDYYRRRYKNPNTALQQQVIKELAKKYNMAVWDLYDIMGGYGSSYQWYKQKLMQRDKVHFTYKGYYIKADLLLTAIVNAWANSTERNPEALLNHFKNLNE